MTTAFPLICWLLQTRCVMIGRRNDVKMAQFGDQIQRHWQDVNDPTKPDITADAALFELEPEQEHVLIEALVELESHNVWVRSADKSTQFSAMFCFKSSVGKSHNCIRAYVQAVLMPAVYQLVPGSMIAKLWFNTLFPPSLDNPVPTHARNTHTHTRARAMACVCV